MRFLIFIFFALNLFAAEISSFTADNIIYDKESEVVIASGGVELSQGKRILFADKVTYSNRKNIVQAEGNISIIEEDGSVFFADKMILRDDLRQAIIDNFSARLVDNSLITAESANRINENIISLKRAVFSSCPVEKGKMPLWQISASDVTLDNEDQRITYKNPLFEVYGFPVLYLPFISHSTPDANRKTGFLAPIYSSESNLGNVLYTPYYLNLAPNYDMTVTPIWASDVAPILHNEFRYINKNSHLNLIGSITNPRSTDLNGNEIDGNNLRGHIEGNGYFQLNENWNWTFSGKRSTDDTYLIRYRFGNEDYLTSIASLNYVSRRNFFKAETMSFQGLNSEDDPGQTPFILPSIDWHLESEQLENGSRFYSDFNSLMLYRSEGRDSKRASAKIGWKDKVIIANNLLELDLSLREDIYLLKDSTPDNEFITRFIPMMELKWSLPLINKFNSGQIMIEPIASFIFTPNNINKESIINEDSLGVELSGGNLFSQNRFTGLDRVESGSRVNYGVRMGIDSNAGEFDAVFGQSYRHRIDNQLEIDGIDNLFSDYVGRLGYSRNNLDLVYNFRMDVEDLTNHKNEVTMNYSYDKVNFYVDYLSLGEDSNSQELEAREELSASASFKATDIITINANSRRDLENDRWIEAGSSIHYKACCADFIVSWIRDFTRDRDIEPSTSISLQVSLKNLN